MATAAIDNRTMERLLRSRGVDTSKLKPSQLRARFAEIINKEAEMPQGQQVQGNPVAETVRTQQEGRERTLNELKSPLTRRDAGGKVQSENASTGIDWLNENNKTGGQSWEQYNHYTPFSPPTPEEIALRRSAQQTPLQVNRGDGITTVQGQYGKGMAVAPEAASAFPRPEFGTGAMGDPMLPSEAPQLGRDIDAGIASAYTPFSQSPTDALPILEKEPPSPSMQNFTANPGAGQVQPILPAVPSPTGLGTEYSPFERPTNPALMQSPLYNPQAAQGSGYPDQQSAVDDFTMESINRDRPALPVAAGRYAGAASARLYDRLANFLWRPGAERGPVAQSQFNGWLNR